MSKTLIIKTGATGDVIRTTVLLHILKGEVYWLTTSYNAALLPSHLHCVSINSQTNSLPENLWSDDFDMVINLEEDIETAQLASKIEAKTTIGTYWENGLLNYTQQSAPWFDMSLISKQGKNAADELKRNNKVSYQEILYGMLGKKFSGEKYMLQNLSGRKKKQIIGIEKNAGSRWPNKAWSGYDELIHILRADRYDTFVFQRRDNISDYIEDISNCSFVITGDTLAMHISLACNIPCIAIFTCTSPDEIYDYGILTKVISPRLYDFFYDTTYDPRAASAVTVDEVVEKFRSVIKF